MYLANLHLLPTESLPAAILIDDFGGIFSSSFKGPSATAEMLSSLSLLRNTVQWIRENSAHTLCHFVLNDQPPGAEGGSRGFGPILKWKG